MFLSQRLLMRVILSHLPVAWRNQYNLTHKTVLESPRAMLLDHENIEKLFVDRYNKKPEPTRPRLQQPLKRLNCTCPRSMHMMEVPIEEPPRRAILPSVASGARRQTGLSRPTIPSSVAGLRRRVALRTSLLSPSVPQGSPGKRQVAEIPVRWLI